ncbi:MAG TPA: AsmA-like C-terminal domain-containing protein, partial [Magnetospirillaceae bacterium]|nr:AsmA-like C-terminal domain-containing protein [Magnetospirillaceae bacterium]
TPFQPPYLTGVMPVDVTAVLTREGRYDIAVRADLGGALLTAPGLDFTKPAGIAAEATAEFQVADDKLLNVSRFHVGGKNLDVAGDVAFERGEIRKVTFANAAFGRTQAAGSLVFRPDGALALTADGGSFDAREIVHGRAADPATDKMPTTPKAPPQHLHPDPPPEVTPLVIQGRFGRIWLSDEGWISNAAADLVRDHHDWRTVHVSGEVGDHAPVRLDIAPSDATHSVLSITGTDAGAASRAMDVFDNMRGGELSITGTYDDKDPARPLAGVARIKNFQLAEAPVLAKLLTVAGLTGIGDLLSGQGIHFNELEMPYTFVDGMLEVKDGEASGSAIGITARGRVDLDNDKLGLEGTVVPAYAINSALGSLPVVGSIFSAEKGGGIIGINYQMKGPMSDPDFMVNPLSALTPGFLRNLFHLFDENPDKGKKPSGNDPHK